MRTTIRLDDQLLKSVKRHAHGTGKSMKTVIEDALRHFFSRRTAKQSRRPVKVKLTTVSGRGVRPGVDLDTPQRSLRIWRDRKEGHSTFPERNRAVHGMLTDQQKKKSRSTEK
ncbi:MAG: type II toxin-antitoxin system VapB family antitoxin [Nitrospira sp.]|nr:type II toxin-antitoxin system VapB family antitoxin [Nitrospira sp.]